MKGIEEETWFEFKSLAAKNNLKAGQFFEKLVEFYKHNDHSFWNDVLKGEKILTEAEANDIRRITKKIRVEKGYRT